MRTSAQRPSLPVVKVCGVTCIEDLEMLAEAGVDAVGFNFVRSSPRYVDAARATELGARAEQLGLVRVAVVMDPLESELSRLLDQIEVDFVQLHGQEDPHIRNACKGLGIIKTISWSGRDKERLLAQTWHSTADQGTGNTTANLHTSPSPTASLSTLRAFLVDAYAPGQGGGTGRIARWDLLSPRPDCFGSIPLILAGGLTPDNVGSAIVQTRPEGVDTASGVELCPGQKSRPLTASFVRQARAALCS